MNTASKCELPHVDDVRALPDEAICRPYIFVTNGGGKTEEERCLDLSRQLELEISPGQFICGHTPMKEMAEKYKTVLVVGGEGEKCRTVAEGYGFKDVVTPGDIIKDNKNTTPFRKLTEEENSNSRSRNFGEQEVSNCLHIYHSRKCRGYGEPLTINLMAFQSHTEQQADCDYRIDRCHIYFRRLKRLGRRSADYSGPPHVQERSSRYEVGDI